MALSPERTEQATKPGASAGRMPSEAKAGGNAQDMLTEGGYSGKQRHLTKARALWHTSLT
jgi:hypothetical protein